MVFFPARIPFALFGLFVLAAGCGPSEAEIRAKRQVQDLTAQLRDTEQRRAALDARLNTLTEESARLTTQVRELGGNVQRTQGELEQARTREADTQRALDELRRRDAQNAARLRTFREMLTRFRALTQSGRLRVRPVRNRMVIELPESVLFESGHAEIKPEGVAVLRQVAQILATIPNRDFMIAGHTDDRPIRTREFPSNWELSSARAANVFKILRDNGVPQRRLSVAGFAEFQPVGNNNTDEGRAQNRRIEIALMPNLEELPDLSGLESETNQ